MATPEEKVIVPTEQLGEAVELAIEQKKTIEGSVKLLESWVRESSILWQDLTDKYVHRACYEYVSKYFKHERESIWAAANYTKGGNGSRVLEHGRSLLDFPLPPTGVPLCKSTSKDRQAAIKQYRAQANTMNHYANWIAAVDKKVGAKKVETVFSHEKLLELKAECE